VGFEISYGKSHMEIVRKWFYCNEVSAGSAAGTVAIIAVTIGMIQKMQSLMASGSETLMLEACGIVMLAMWYTPLAHILNKTHFIVSRGMIEVRHRPLPWPGNKKLIIKNIKQLYVREKVRIVEGERRSQEFYYEVRAILRRRHVTLYGPLQSSEQAFYIEQKIEEYLGIEDVPVAGEGGR
jgi:hypothetical protein